MNKLALIILMSANDAVSTRSFVFVCVRLFHVEFSLHLVKYITIFLSNIRNDIMRWQKMYRVNERRAVHEFLPKE